MVWIRALVRSVYAVPTHGTMHQFPVRRQVSGGRGLPSLPDRHFGTSAMVYRPFRWVSRVATARKVGLKTVLRD